MLLDLQLLSDYHPLVVVSLFSYIDLAKILTEFICSFVNLHLLEKLIYWISLWIIFVI